MATEWSQAKVGQVTHRVTKGTTPTTVGGRFVDAGIVFVKVESITDDGRFDTTKFAYIDEPTNSLLSRSVLHEHDILFTIAGTIGRVAMVPRAILPANTNQAVAIVRPNPDLVEPRFLYYALRDELRVRHAYTRVVQSVQANFSLTELSELEIPLPQKQDQCAIAHILGSLDDKIELNRRINETLEEMARAIFKSWFVDFDPIRAKAEDRDTGLLPEISDLFPDSFEASDLGEIPQGWEVGSFGDLVSRRTERVGDRQAVVLSAVAQGELIRSDQHFTKRVYSKDISKYLLVEQWDFAYNPSRINIGSIGMLKESLTGAVSPVYVVVHPHPSYRWFTEFSLRHVHTKEWIRTLATGSVRQSLSYSDFASIPCVIPPPAVIGHFDCVWASLRESIVARSAESHTLSALRDALLPKLLSGEIRVDDVPDFVA